ncbi:hypothetical protein UPYG_G00214420 [Umbra pygmaea]|uniref:Ig-like domain-containing protein n=1 Tax=Umbra pygmaea TaxID=75934 RepID=A0ABD0WQP1_UMBPY
MKEITGAELSYQACLLMIIFFLSLSLSCCDNSTCVHCCNVTSECKELCLDTICCNATECKELFLDSKCCNTNGITPMVCIKDYLTVQLKSTPELKVTEGGNVNLMCISNFSEKYPKKSVFVWSENGKPKPNYNTSNITLTNFGLKTPPTLRYSCTIQGPCGNFTSQEIQLQTEDMSVLIIVICGAAALVLVLAMGFSMKCMLNREFQATKNRRQQNAQHIQSTTTIVH